MEPSRRQRRSIRLSGYDYAQAGMYFVTICTEGRACLLSTIADSELELTAIGRIVEEEWLRTPVLRPLVRLDEFVIMPNHLHALLEFAEAETALVGAYCNTPLQKHPATASHLFRSPSQTLGAIIRGFKGSTTRRVNELRQSPGVPLWQRNYYEHVVRDEADLERLREYIASNPARWAEDEDNPARPTPSRTGAAPPRPE